MIGPGFKRWIYLLIQSRLDSNFRWINLAYIIFHFEYILGLFWVMHFSIKDEGEHTRMLETFVTIFFLSYVIANDWGKYNITITNYFQNDFEIVKHN